MVMVITADGTAKKKNITIGISTKEKTQVLEGLSADDTVITGGAFGLDDGTKVKIEAAKKEGDDEEEKPEAGEKKPAAGEKE
jgi:hypothetical protein